mgnify:CR=1 FL=1
MGRCHERLGGNTEYDYQMTMAIPQMVDLVFDISGDSVPVNYPF